MSVQISTLDEETLELTSVIQAGDGGQWHCVDFGEVYVLMNGSATVARQWDVDGAEADGDDQISWDESDWKDRMATSPFTESALSQWDAGPNWLFTVMNVNVGAKQYFSPPLAVGKYRLEFDVEFMGELPTDFYLVAYVVGEHGSITNISAPGFVHGRPGDPTTIGVFSFSEEFTTADTISYVLVTPLQSEGNAFSLTCSITNMALIPIVATGAYVTAATTNRIGTGCVHKQTRMVFGDIESNRNFVGWSCLGTEDLDYILNNTSLPTGWDKYNESEMGMPMPFRGTVQKMIPLGDNVIVYGDDGVFALQERLDPFPRYAVVPIDGLGAGVGILNRGAADGNDDGHMFIAQDHSLWTIGPNLRATKLGFSEFIANCGDTAVLTYWPQLMEWHISGQYTRYVLNSWGMGGPMQSGVTSFIEIDGTRYAAGEVDTTARYWELWTGPFSLNERGRKTVTAVNVESDGATALQVAANYRFTGSGTWKRVAWTRTAPGGAGRIKAAFVDVEVGVKGNYVAATGSHVTNIYARYKFNDRRFRRGTIGSTGRPLEE